MIGSPGTRLFHPGYVAGVVAFHELPSAPMVATSFFGLSWGCLDAKPAHPILIRSIAEATSAARKRTALPSLK